MVTFQRNISINKGNDSEEVSILYCVSYVRVSTKMQTAESKTGLARQEKAFIIWLRNHLEYTEWGQKFYDLGISGRGKNSTVGALSKFLEKARKGEFPPKTCLVVEETSRLTREAPMQALKLVIEIFELGHTIAFCEEGGRPCDGQGHADWSNIVHGIEVASREWVKKRDRKVGSLDEQNENLIKGDLSNFKPRTDYRRQVNFPFWLQLVEMEDRSKNYFVEIPEKLELVRKCFKYGLTMGSPTIARKLRDEGYQGVQKKNKPLTEGVIKEHILKNRQVLGEKEFRGEIHQNIFPCIIDPDEFYAVDAAMKKRTGNITNTARPSAKMRNLFQGGIFCATCGGRMSVHQREDGKTIGYLYCANASKKNLVECGKSTLVPYYIPHQKKDNELEILNCLQNFRWSTFFTDEKHELEVKTIKDKKRRLTEQKSKVSKKLNNLKLSRTRCWENNEPVDTELTTLINSTQKEYDKHYADYQLAGNDLQNLLRKLTGIEAEKDIQKVLKTFKEKDRFIPEKRKDFNRWFVDLGLAVVVNKDITEKDKSNMAFFKGKHPDELENYTIEIGKGMYDFFTGKFKGLNQVEDASNAFGMDMKQVKEEEAKREEHYRKMSEEAGSDIRFSRSKK